MDEYPKIYGPYKRATEGPNRNKVIFGDWSRPEFEYLSNNAWVWTEKVDGTNIRVHWDGHAVTFGGRTDNASIPAKLVTRLRELFPEDLFEQTFQDTAVTLYGEGYGAGIQKGGGNYKRDGVDFVLFDVKIGPFWLLRDDVRDIATKMGLGTFGVVPVELVGTPHEAIKAITFGVTSAWGAPPFMAEGLVGVPLGGFLDRAGRRIMMKVKSADFHVSPPLPTQPAIITPAPAFPEVRAA